MSNPLFNVLNKDNPINKDIQSFVAEVERIQKTYSGDPRDQVQKMLNSGQLTQDKFNEYAQIANQLMAVMGSK